MSNIAQRIDKIASELESKGVKDIAAMLDSVSNTIDKYASRPEEAFVFPPSSSKDKKGHFPIPDLAHARNALARANQYGESPSWYEGSLESLKKSVANAVKRKFPSIEVTEESYK